MKRMRGLYKHQSGGDIQNLPNVDAAKKAYERFLASKYQNTPSINPSDPYKSQPTPEFNLSNITLGKRRKERVNKVKKITAVTQWIPYLSIPSNIINSTIGINDTYNSYKTGDMQNAGINAVGSIPFIPTSKLRKLGTSLQALGFANNTYGTATDLTDNFGLENKQKGGNIPINSAGLWEEEGPVIIPGNNITMKGVEGRVLGIDDLGNHKIMHPNKNYKFRGKRVLEIPLYQQGGLWDTNKKAWVDSTLSANKNLDFVKRLYQNNTPSIQIPGVEGRSTHRMANDNTRAYPEVVNRNGVLVNLPGDQGWDYADSTKEYINFLNPQQAEWFASNGYKQGTGVLNSITNTGKKYNNPKYQKGGSLNSLFDKWDAEDEEDSSSPENTAPTTDDIEQKQRELAIQQQDLVNREAKLKRRGIIDGILSEVYNNGTSNRFESYQPTSTNINPSIPTPTPTPTQVVNSIPRQFNPAPSNQMALIKQTAINNGVPPEILAGVYGVESSFGRNPNAFVPNKAGALGYFQFTKGTAQDYGVDRMDFQSSATGAAKYLKDLYNQFGDWKLAVAGYNTGSGNIRSYLRGKKKLHPETQAYIPKVMNYAANIKFE